MVRLPDCLHLFHADCLHPWLKQRNTCPLCKQPAIRVYPGRPRLDRCARRPSNPAFRWRTGAQPCESGVGGHMAPIFDT